jgi:hypothetical protein
VQPSPFLSRICCLFQFPSLGKEGPRPLRGGSAHVLCLWNLQCLPDLLDLRLGLSSGDVPIVRVLLLPWLGDLRSGSLLKNLWHERLKLGVSSGDVPIVRVLLLPWLSDLCSGFLLKNLWHERLKLGVSSGDVPIVKVLLLPWLGDLRRRHLLRRRE